MMSVRYKIAVANKIEIKLIKIKNKTSGQEKLINGWPSFFGGWGSKVVSIMNVVKRH